MTRFIAISLRSYQTWRMRMTLTLVMLTALALLPLRSEAFDLEQALKEQHVQYQGEPEYRVAQGNCTSLSQAIEQIRSRTGGRVVSAETRVKGGREVHHIKVLTPDGKVRTHKVNGCRR